MNTKYYACRYADGSVSFFSVREKSRQLVLSDDKINLYCYQMWVTYRKHFSEVKVITLSRFMLLNHYIEWLYCDTDQCGQFIMLEPRERPDVTFCVPKGDRVRAVYFYCRLHGLRKIEAIDFKISATDPPVGGLPDIKDMVLQNKQKGE